MRPLRRLKQPLLTALCAVLSLALRPLARPRPLPASVGRALLMRPCCLGDVLLTTAAVRALALAWPDARLDYLVGSAAAAGLAHNPRLSRLIDAPAGVVAYLRLAQQLRRDHYDVAFVFDRAPQWSLLALLIGVPVRAGFDSRWRGLGLTHRVTPHVGQHESELAAGVVRSLGLPVADLREEYQPSAAARVCAAALLAPLPPGLRVMLHPGGGVNSGMTLLAKRWPAPRFAALIDRLAAAGATPILVGAAADRAVVDAVLAELPSRITATDLAGRLDLDAHAALAAACDLYIGHDSGPTHLAAAAGAPVVAIFGPTDPGVYAPPGDRVRVAWRGARQDPALDLRDRHADEAAILAVTVEDVWLAAVELLPGLATNVTRPGGPS
ncbi:MAG: glycosyltransferase family 9 protein [Chloroflexi bacterium]|nr:glycosyltransferase family 9 protein [Chloroflexota bacterium]